MINILTATTTASNAEGIIGLLILLVAIVVIVCISCVKIVPQARAYVIERLGVYNGTWKTGLHFKFRLLIRSQNALFLWSRLQIFRHRQLLLRIM